MEEVEEIQHKANLRIQNTEKKYEKKVALLEQKLELVNIMLQEARERELRSKKSYQTLMMTLNDLESHSKNNTMLKIEKEIQLLRQEKNQDAQNYRNRCDELFTMLESSIKKDTEFYSSKKNSLMNELIKGEDTKPQQNVPNPEDEQMDQKIITCVNNENMRLRREMKEVETRNKELCKMIKDLESQVKTEQSLYQNNLEKLRQISQNGVDSTILLRLQSENAILRAKTIDQNREFSHTLEDIRAAVESGSADNKGIKKSIIELLSKGQEVLSQFQTSVKKAKNDRDVFAEIGNNSGLDTQNSTNISPCNLGEVYSYQPNYEQLFLAKLSSAKAESLEKNSEAKNSVSQNSQHSVSDRIDSKTQTKMIRSIDIDRFFLEDDDQPESEAEDDLSAGSLGTSKAAENNKTKKSHDPKEQAEDGLEWDGISGAQDIQPDFVATLTTNMRDEILGTQSLPWEGEKAKQERSESSSVYFINREPTLASKCKQSMSASLALQGRNEDKMPSSTNEVCKNLGEMFEDYSVGSEHDQEVVGRRSHNLQQVVPAFGSREARSSSLQARKELNGIDLVEKKSNAQKTVLVNLNQDKVSPADEVFKKLMEKKLQEARVSKIDAALSPEHYADQATLQSQNPEAEIATASNQELVFFQEEKIISDSQNFDSKGSQNKSTTQKNEGPLALENYDVDDSRKMLEQILGTKPSEPTRHTNHSRSPQNQGILSEQTDGFHGKGLLPINQGLEDPLILDSSEIRESQQNRWSRFEKEKSQLQREILSSNEKSSEDVTNQENSGQIRDSNSSKKFSTDQNPQENDQLIEDEELVAAVIETQRANQEHKTEEEYANQEILFNLTETVNHRESEPRNSSPQDKTFEVSTIHEGFNSTGPQNRLVDKIDCFDPHENYFGEEDVQGFRGDMTEDYCIPRLNFTEKVNNIGSLIKTCSSETKPSKSRVNQDDEYDDNISVREVHEEKSAQELRSIQDQTPDVVIDGLSLAQESQQDSRQKMLEEDAKSTGRGQSFTKPPISKSKSGSGRNLRNQIPNEIRDDSFGAQAQEAQMRPDQQSAEMAGFDFGNLGFESFQQNLDTFDPQEITPKDHKREQELETYKKNDPSSLSGILQEFDTTKVPHDQVTNPVGFIGRDADLEKLPEVSTMIALAQNSLQARIEQYRNSDLSRKSDNCSNSSEVNISDSRGEDNLNIRNLSGEFERTTEKKGNSVSNIWKLDPHFRLHQQDHAKELTITEVYQVEPEYQELEEPNSEEVRLAYQEHPRSEQSSGRNLQRSCDSSKVEALKQESAIEIEHQTSEQILTTLLTKEGSKSNGYLEEAKSISRNQILSISEGLISQIKNPGESRHSLEGSEKTPKNQIQKDIQNIFSHPSRPNAFTKAELDQMEVNPEIDSILEKYSQNSRSRSRIHESDAVGNIAPASGVQTGKPLVSNSTERILKKIAEYSERKQGERLAQLASPVNALELNGQEDRKNSFDHVLNFSNHGAILEQRKQAKEKSYKQLLDIINNIKDGQGSSSRPESLKQKALSALDRSQGNNRRNQTQDNDQSNLSGSAISQNKSSKPSSVSRKLNQHLQKYRDQMKVRKASALNSPIGPAEVNESYTPSKILFGGSDSKYRSPQSNDAIPNIAIVEGPRQKQIRMIHSQVGSVNSDSNKSRSVSAYKISKGKQGFIKHISINLVEEPQTAMSPSELMSHIQPVGSDQRWWNPSANFENYLKIGQSSQRRMCNSKSANLLPARKQLSPHAAQQDTSQTEDETVFTTQIDEQDMQPRGLFNQILLQKQTASIHNRRQSNTARAQIMNTNSNHIADYLHGLSNRAESYRHPHQGGNLNQAQSRLFSQIDDEGYTKSQKQQANSFAANLKKIRYDYADGNLFEGLQEVDRTPHSANQRKSTQYNKIHLLQNPQHWRRHSNVPEPFESQTERHGHKQNRSEIPAKSARDMLMHDTQNEDFLDSNQVQELKVDPKLKLRRLHQQLAKLNSQSRVNANAPLGEIAVTSNFENSGLGYASLPKPSKVLESVRRLSKSKIEEENSNQMFASKLSDQIQDRRRSSHLKRPRLEGLQIGLDYSRLSIPARQIEGQGEENPTGGRSLRRVSSHQGSSIGSQSSSRLNVQGRRFEAFLNEGPGPGFTRKRSKMQLEIDRKLSKLSSRDLTENHYYSVHDSIVMMHDLLSDKVKDIESQLSKRSTVDPQPRNITD